MATLFDKLYAATEEATKALKKPFVLNKVNRALDGASDHYESAKLDKQDQINNLLARLANGDVNVIGQLIEARLSLVGLEAQAVEAAKIKQELASEA